MPVFCHSFVFENCIEYTANISTVQNKQLSNQLQQNTVYHGSPVQSTLHVFLALQAFWYLENLGYAKIALGTISLRRRQNFQDFSPLSPYRQQFFTTIRWQIREIFDP